MSMSVLVLILLFKLLLQVQSAPKMGLILEDPLVLEAERFSNSDDDFLTNDPLSDKDHPKLYRIETKIKQIIAKTSQQDVGLITTTTKMNETSTKTPEKEIQLSQVWKRLRESKTKDKPKPKPKGIARVLKLNLRDDSQPSNGNQGETKPCGYEYDMSKCKYVNDRLMCGYDKNQGELKNVDDEIADMGNGCVARGDRIECGYKASDQGSSQKSNNSDTKVRAGHSTRITLLETTVVTASPEFRAKVETKKTTELSQGTKLETEKATEVSQGTKLVTEKATELSQGTKLELVTEKATEVSQVVTLELNNTDTTTNLEETQSTYPIPVPVKRESINSTVVLETTTEANISESTVNDENATTNSTCTTCPNANPGRRNDEKKRACVEKDDHIFCYDL